MLYLLKINVALVLLYGFYRLMVSRDTFFSLRRFTLWLIYGVALLAPAFNVAYWMKENSTVVSMAGAYADAVYPMVAAEPGASVFAWQDALVWIYIVGVAWLSLRLLWQLFVICRMAYVSQRQEMEGVTLHVLKGAGSPFSFFRWIFVYPAILEDARLHEVLVHERTHVRELHSLDCIFSELFAILCWWNPFAWLMKQEVRINLEYLADESVLSDGNARKSYQYHLLGLAYRKPVHSAEIANNFNLLPLKKRIKMMNKRRTSEMGKAKYLLFAPLAAALLLVSNIETVAREVSEQLPEKVTVQEKSSSPSENVDLAAFAQKTKQTVGTKKKAKQAQQTKSSNKTQKDKKSTIVYDVAETMPQFPGGHGEFMKYMTANVKYPKAAVLAKKQGRVIVTFVIDKDGNVTEPKVLRSVDEALDAEALRVISSSPKWIPGTQDGKPVNVKYTVPVFFQLPAAKEAEQK